MEPCINYFSKKTHKRYAASDIHYLLMSRLSQTMRVSTAPRSSPLSVSSTMKQYLPVSWLISSKYFCSSRFSCNMENRAKGYTVGNSIKNLHGIVLAFRIDLVIASAAVCMSVFLDT